MAILTNDIVAVQKVNGNTFTYTLRITVLSQSTANKTSRCRIEAIVQQSSSGVCYQNKQAGVSCTVNGTRLFSDYKSRTLQGTEEHCYNTWEGTFQHNEIGVLSLAVSGAYWINAPTSAQPKRINLSGTMTLPPITNYCTIGASDALIGSNTTIVLTDDPDNTHSVHFQFGGAEGYIGADGLVYAEEQKFTEKVLSFCLPAFFYEEIPLAKSDVCTLKMQSYRGSLLTGHAKTSFVAKTNEAVCAPLLSAAVADQNPDTLTLTGDENCLVRFFSVPCCQAEAQGQNGAVISAVQVNGQPCDGEVVLEPVQSGTFRFTATDTRGYTTEMTVEKELLPYIRLTCNPTARRTAPTTGQVALTLSGSVWQGNFGTAENTVTAKCRVAGDPWQEIPLTMTEDHRYQGELLLEGLDYTYSHVIEIQVSDLLDTVSVSTIVSKGLPVFSWGEDYFCFHVPVHFEAGVTGLT